MQTEQNVPVRARVVHVSLSCQQQRRLQAWFPRLPLHAAAGDGRRLLPPSCSCGETVPTLERSAADLIDYFPALCYHKGIFINSLNSN